MQLAKMPPLVERLVVEAIRRYVPADAIAAMVESYKVELFAWLEAKAAETETTVDDTVVAAVKDAFSQCDVGGDFVCELVTQGQAATVAFLAMAAKRSETKIDDAIVEVVAKAMKVELPK